MAAEDDKCDWTDRKYLEPILAALKEWLPLLRTGKTGIWGEIMASSKEYFLFLELEKFGIWEEDMRMLNKKIAIRP